MAIVEHLDEKRQTPSAQKAVIDYCMNPEKTRMDERTVFVTGVNCVSELAHESFLATQALFGHQPTGPRFYHYVQSFPKDENVDPELVHQIGVELAQAFGNREVLVATHLDKAHLHSHFVVNAYDLETGVKLHANKFQLADLRDESDRLCRKYGLSVLEKRYDPEVKATNLNRREYRAADKGESWKLALCCTIDRCMASSLTRADFIRQMKEKGYGVTWTDERKYITYSVRYRGKEVRVRDQRLHEDKYLKENMEHEFRIRHELFGTDEGEERSREGGGVGWSSARTERTDGADFACGMEADRSGFTADGRAFGAAVRTGETFGITTGGPGEILQAGGDAMGGAEENRGAGDDWIPGKYDPTGWERDRESLLRYRAKQAAESDTHGHSDRQSDRAVPSAMDHLRMASALSDGLFHMGHLLEDQQETEEERRKRIEAENVSAVVGVALGSAILIGEKMAEKQKNTVKTGEVFRENPEEPDENREEGDHQDEETGGMMMM